MSFSLSAPLFVEVAVPLPIDHPFTYRVPLGEEHRAQVGVRVLIPFGGRRMTGLVTAITDASGLGGRDVKDLIAILDETPYVSERHLAFLSATARGCLAPLGETLRAALPRGLPRKEAPSAPRMEAFYRSLPFPPEGPMTPKQRLTYETVREAGGLSSTDLSLRIPGGAEAAKRLAAKGFLLVESR
jgi:primosomal protein N'